MNPKASARIAYSIVKDSKSGDCIVKLVNLLPVSIDMEFQDLILPGQKIEKTVLTGKPDSKTAKQVTEIVYLQENKIYLPEYSFTVLRITSLKQRK